MAILRVEVHEVGEDQTCRRRRQLTHDEIHAVIVGRRVHRSRQAPAGEKILDLADTHDDVTGGGEAVEQRSAYRLEREVASIGGASEVARRADERPRDDAPDAQPACHELERDVANAVLLVDRDDLLVSRNLEDAVGRRVHDRRARAHVLRPQLIDDHRAGRDDVADRRAADPALELAHDIGAEAVRKRGKRRDRARCRRFPSDRSPSPCRATPRPSGRPPRAPPERRRRCPRCARARAIAASAREAAPRARCCPTVLLPSSPYARRIGQLADADRVHHDEDDALNRHRRSAGRPRRGRGPRRPSRAPRRARRASVRQALCGTRSTDAARSACSRAR